MRVATRIWLSTAGSHNTGYVQLRSSLGEIRAASVVIAGQSNSIQETRQSRPVASSGPGAFLPQRDVRNGVVASRMDVVLLQDHIARQLNAKDQREIDQERGVSSKTPPRRYEPTPRPNG